MIPFSPSTNSLKIYDARYLDEEASTPDKLWRRVSGGNEEYYQLMKQGLFLPNSPTLFNAGKKQGGTLSACFVFDVMDALLGDWPDGGCQMPFTSSIAGTAFKAMAVAKAGGGVGYYLGNIRRRGAEVKSTHKRACGPVTVLRWYNTLNWLITQGGKRALAQMGILDATHPDIREFIHCKDENPHELSSFNISVSWRDEQLKQINWEKFQARSEFANEWESLWWEQCQSAWKTGDPGMFFWNTTNQFNATPHLGDINATNPCGETPNISDEPCNLGSSVLSRFFKYLDGPKKWVFMWNEFKDWLKVMIRFMDDILEWNIFPHPDITKAALLTRKLGLGVMGYADALAMQGIPYDSQDAVDWGTEVAKVIEVVALQESQYLANVKGPYLAYETASEETKKRFPFCRNSTRTSIAPTGTIALLADASSSIEPFYALEWERVTGEGIKLKERVPVHDLIPEGHTPKTAKDIDWRWHVKHQAAWQRHVDLGVSKTINLPNNATVKDISDAYHMMWGSGCKGGTVFRDGCRSEQVLRETKTQAKSVYVQQEIKAPEAFLPTDPGNIAQWKAIEEQGKKRMEEYFENLHRRLDVPKLTLPEIRTRRKLPKERKAEIIKFNIFGCEGYLIPGLHEDGSLGEIFIELANDGSTLAGMTKAFAKTFSLALQNHTKLEDLVKLHRNSVFEPRGRTGDPDVPTCTSIADFIVRKLEKKFIKKEEVMTVMTVAEFPVESGYPKVETKPADGVDRVEIDASDFTFGSTGQYCPDCGGELIREGICMKCLRPECGYSKC